MYKTLPSVSARLSGTTAFSMFSVRRYMYACITRGKKHHKRLQQASRGTWGRFVHPKPVIIACLTLSANFLFPSVETLTEQEAEKKLNNFKRVTIQSKHRTKPFSFHPLFQPVPPHSRSWPGHLQTGLCRSESDQTGLNRLLFG